MKFNFDKSYISHYVLESIQDELRAIGIFIRYQWRILLVIILAFTAFVIYFKPIPPSKIRMSSGAPNSSLELTALTFAENLRKAGVAVELIPSKGALESLSLLEDDVVDVALTMSGIKVPESDSIESLGSVEYQPLWLFATKDLPSENALVNFIKNKNIYIGRPGTATYQTTLDYLSALFHNFKKASNLRANIGPKDAVDLMETGQLDGMFLVAGFGSKNVKRLVQDGRTFMVNFPEVDSMTQKISGVEKIKIPKGMFYLWPPFPKHDVNMVARTSVLLVKSDLHPAIQYILLDAAKNINSTDQNMLNRNSGFPKFIDPNVKRSKIAERYYEKGLPATWGHFPYWLSTFIDTAGFKLLGLFALIYPLFSLLPKHRRFVFEAHASSLYSEMFRLCHALDKASHQQEIEEICLDIELLGERINSTWAPKGSKQEYALLLSTMLLISKRAGEKSGRSRTDS